MAKSTTPPRRFESDPTVPIPASRMRELLAAEGNEPVPDDETPTSPRLDPGAFVRPPCGVCRGGGFTVVPKPDGGWRGPVKCDVCEGSGFAPVTVTDPEDA